MEAKPKTTLHIETIVIAPIDVVWKSFTEPQHIMQWNQASADWHCPAATNDLKAGGKFSSTMAAKDGSMSFDFTGTYTEVDTHHTIAYVMDDGRQVKVTFTQETEGVRITTDFEAENQNSLEMQQEGWQAILNSFKSYTESL